MEISSSFFSVSLYSFYAYGFRVLTLSICLHCTLTPAYSSSLYLFPLSCGSAPSLSSSVFIFFCFFPVSSLPFCLDPASLLAVYYPSSLLLAPVQICPDVFIFASLNFSYPSFLGTSLLLRLSSICILLVSFTFPLFTALLSLQMSYNIPWFSSFD